MAINIQRAIRCSAEELCAPGMPEKLVELIEGALVEVTPAGHFHNKLAFRFQLLFEKFTAGQNDLEVGYSDEGYLLRRNPDTILCPDAALFRRRPEGASNWLEFGPEIVVEILSPSNSLAEMTYKRQVFFAAGTEQCWIMDPKAESLQVHHRDGRVEHISKEGTYSGEGIVKGLEVNLRSLLKR